MRHLHGRIQGGLLCKQGGIDDDYPVIGVVPTSHERKSRLTANQSYLDIDAVDQEFILLKEIHIRSTTRLLTKFARRVTNPALAAGPSTISTASMRAAVSLCHS